MHGINFICYKLWGKVHVICMVYKQYTKINRFCILRTVMRSFISSCCWFAKKYISPNQWGPDQIIPVSLSSLPSNLPKGASIKTARVKNLCLIIIKQYCWLCHDWFTCIYRMVALDGFRWQFLRKTPAVRWYSKIVGQTAQI